MVFFFSGSASYAPMTYSGLEGNCEESGLICRFPSFPAHTVGTFATSNEVNGHRVPYVAFRDSSV